jgi:hypothetical protein
MARLLLVKRKPKCGAKHALGQGSVGALGDGGHRLHHTRTPGDAVLLTGTGVKVIGNGFGRAFNSCGGA